MLNFYRRFIPRAAEQQAPLNSLLKENAKGNKPIPWTTEADSAFYKCKEALSDAALLAHPRENSPLAITSDASDTHVGAVLQQLVDGNWEPLGFFSKKLSPAESRYGAYDREMLAVYKAIKFFRHMVEARTFIVFTDHKPLIFAFRQRTEKCSPRQFRYLDFIGQFTTDIRHVSGKDNVVADALSRVDEIRATIDYHQLAQSQRSDEELRKHLQRDSPLQLKLVRIPDSNAEVYCDVSTAVARPYITPQYRRAAFDVVHQLSHPGVSATVKLATQRFVWPCIKKDIRQLAQSCLACQRAKVTRHVGAPLGSFQAPSARFEHVHIDIVVMPMSEGKRYCLTCVDRFTRWPEAFPISDQEATTVARVFFKGWIARFGTPLRITSDQGRQFESHLFKELCRLTGATHLRTTAYHPQSNGMVERFHRQLKSAIRCHANDRWTDTLPAILLGVRNAWRDDCQATSAELVYGEPLRLPGEFLQASHREGQPNATELAQELREQFSKLRPTPASRHCEKRVFVFKDLQSSSHVFVRHDMPRSILQCPYDGPFEVLSRNDKTFVVRIRGKKTRVTVDRLKPAYLLASSEDDGTEASNHQGCETENSDSHTNTTTRSGRRVRFPKQIFCPNSGRGVM